MAQLAERLRLDLTNALARDFEVLTDFLERVVGGIMPSADLFQHFQADLRIAETWQVDGTHHARTAEAWYTNLVAQRAAIERLLGRRHYQRWRVFFLACAELFGYANGREWIVAHVRFVPQPGT